MSDRAGWLEPGRGTWGVAAGLALLLAGTAGCERQQAAKGAGEPPPPLPVVVAEAVRQTVPIYGDFVGQTEANATVELRARVEGTLEKALFQEGSRVKAGDVLFQIDPREYQAKLESARAQLAKAQADLAFARQQVESQKAQAQLDRDLANLDYARQQVESQKAQAQLDRDLANLDYARQQVESQRAQAQLDRDVANLAFAKQQVQILKAQAQVVEEEAKLAKAQQDVARLRPLVAQDAVPTQDLDNALAAEQVARASVASARASLENTRLSERRGIETGEATVGASRANLRNVQLQETNAIKQAEAAVASSRANLQNVRLSEKTQIELAEAAGQAARASVTRTELDLGYTTARSPIDGLVGRLAVNVGNLVGRGESTLLATVSSPDPIYVNFAVSEADYLRLAKRVAAEGPHARAKGAFELVLGDDSVFPQRGDFGLIERALDARTGTLTVRTVFPNPEALLRPGQFGRVRVVLEERRDAVLVPRRAIVQVQDAKAVLVVGVDNKVALRTVQLAEGYQELVIVTSGLQGGEKVIVEGQQKARPGATVAPTSQPRPAPAAPAPATGSPPAGAPAPPPAGTPKG